MLLLTGCDLATKAYARAKLMGERPVVVVPGFWDFRYAENRDVGFSLLSVLPHDVRQPVIFTLVTIGLIAVLIYGARRWYVSKALFGSVLIASGALGNLINRAKDGYVIDFVHWFVGDFSWPIFNVADVLVVFGVGLVIWHEMTLPVEPPTAPVEPPAAGPPVST